MSRRDLWLGLVRTVIVVALVSSAARLIAIAYWPQSSPPRPALQELACPPLPATNLESVVTPPPRAIAATSTTSDQPGGLLVNDSAWRPLTAKQAEQRKTSKKQPAYTPQRKAGPPQRAAPVELAKRDGHGVNPKEPKPTSHPPMLAQSEAYLSPFGDMHGQ
jgi:hypothetical protein